MLKMWISIRFWIAECLFWLFLKTLPNSVFKEDFIEAILTLRPLYPRKDSEK